MSEKAKDDTGPKGNQTGTKVPAGRAPLGIVIEQIRKKAEQAKEESGRVPLHIEERPEIFEDQEDGDGDGDGEEASDPEELSQKPFIPEIGGPVGQRPDGSPQEQDDDGIIERDTSWGTDLDPVTVNTGYTIQM